MNNDPSNTNDLGSDKASPNINPFNPKRLAINHTGGESFASQKLLTTLSVRKPNSKEWVHAHPSDEYAMAAAIFEDSEKGQPYIVAPEIAGLHPSEIRRVGLRLAVNRQGVPFLWQHPLFEANERENFWNTSHRSALQEAQSRWIRMISNKVGGFYDVHVAQGISAPPVWPEYDLEKLLTIAFAGRLIVDDNHILLRQLRGEI